MCYDLTVYRCGHVSRKFHPRACQCRVRCVRETFKRRYCRASYCERRAHYSNNFYEDPIDIFQYDPVYNYNYSRPIPRSRHRNRHGRRSHPRYVHRNMMPGFSMFFPPLSPSGALGNDDLMPGTIDFNGPRPSLLYDHPPPGFDWAIRGRAPNGEIMMTMEQIMDLRARARQRESLVPGSIFAEQDRTLGYYGRLAEASTQTPTPNAQLSMALGQALSLAAAQNANPSAPAQNHPLTGAQVIALLRNFAARMTNNPRSEFVASQPSLQSAAAGPGTQSGRRSLIVSLPYPPARPAVAADGAAQEGAATQSGAAGQPANNEQTAEDDVEMEEESEWGGGDLSSDD
ncbi:hypothetical protein ABW21_db0204164 [Orbilia brochopaga]|nr:hypothetical protein ABW21_db0204164 [Drechslerella brochopaga]